MPWHLLLDTVYTYTHARMRARVCVYHHFSFEKCYLKIYF